MDTKGFIHKLLKENLNTLTNFNNFKLEWGGFILDSTDYNESDLLELYKIGLSDLNKILVNNKLIYRGMGVNNNWVKYYKNNEIIKLGKFWSLDRNISKNFTTASDIYDNNFSKFNGPIKLSIISKIPSIGFIDVNSTIAHMWVSSESELTLLDNSPLEIVNIIMNNTSILTDKNYII